MGGSLDGQSPITTPALHLEDLSAVRVLSLKLRYLIFVAAVIWFGLPVEAFTTCIVSNIVAPKVEGRIVVTLKGHESAVPGAEVDLFRPGDNGSMVAKTNADSSGRFRISGVKSGRYRLRAVSPGLLPAEAIIEVNTRRLVLFPRHGTLLVSLGLMLDRCPFIETVRQ